MKFRYTAGPNLTNFYGYDFSGGEPTEVTKPEVIRKCTLLPVFEAVEETEPKPEPKPRGRKRKVNHDQDEPSKEGAGEDGDRVTWADPTERGSD